MNNKYLEIYNSLNKEFNTFLLKYSDKVCEILESRKKAVVKRMYARGGIYFLRGYFLPSPVFDINIGNANRGKLLKRIQKQQEKSGYTIPNDGKWDYEYCFDKDDKLIISIRTLSLYNEYELLFYEGNTVWGIEFNKNSKLIEINSNAEIYSPVTFSRIAKSVYDGDKILSYIQAESIYHYKNHFVFSQLHQETYKYGNGLMDTAYFDDYYVLQSTDLPKIHRKTALILNHDENGNVVSYRTKEYDDDGVEKHPERSDHIYIVSKSKIRRI